MEVSYNTYLVGLSYAIAVFGSFTALQLAIRIPSSNGGAMWGWLISAALALGGGAIWSMHFIGMLAFKTPMKVGYDPLLTAASLVIAVIIAAVGLFIVGRGQASLFKLLFAGTAGGLGVCAMHYSGMAAMIMPATIQYDMMLVGLSVVIAIAAATVALWLAFNLRGNLQRFGSALVMGAAVCGMHYTGMAAVTMVPTGRRAVNAISISPELMAVSIFGVTAVLLVFLLIVAMFQVSEHQGGDAVVFE